MHYASRLKYFLCRKICRSINHKMTFHNATELSDRIHPERVLHVFILVFNLLSLQVALTCSSVHLSTHTVPKCTEQSA